MSLYEKLQDQLNGHSYNGYFTCNCVFHSDHSPSLFVYEDGKYRCASCGAHGTHAYLDKYLGGHGVKSAPAQKVVLPRWSSWEARYGDLTGIATHAHNACKKFPQYMWYFKKRKIEQFFEQGYFGFIDNWALFPVFNPEHKIENIVVRHTKNVGTRYVIKKVDEQKPLLYVPSWERVMMAEVVYVVYGVVDAWAFESIELPVVTGITGKSLSAEVLKPLGKEFVIVPDEYETQEAHRLANSLGWRATVKKIKFPEGTKDPDGLRSKFSNEYLIGALA